MSEFYSLQQFLDLMPISLNIPFKHNFEVIFIALPGEYNISRRGRSAKSHFPCDVYHVLGRYSILFDVPN